MHQIGSHEGARLQRIKHKLIPIFLHQKRQRRPIEHKVFIIAQLHKLQAMTHECLFGSSGDLSENPNNVVYHFDMISVRECAFGFYSSTLF